MQTGYNSDTPSSVIIQARTVFSLPPIYSHDSLTSAYRRVALRCHPDKGGRQDLFETVRECYRVLFDNARAVGMWLSQNVGGDYDNITSTRAEDIAHPRADIWRTRGSSVMTPSKGSSFNVVEFNRRYEDSRLENKERDTGYSGWLSKAASEFKEASAPIISPKAGATAFNSAFENYTPALDSQSGAIIVKPGELSAGGLTGALLDDDEEVGDYTTEVGGGISGADCRIAHSSQRLASSSWARDEISVDRGTISRITAERSNNITAAASSANLGRDIQLALGGLASR